MPSRRSPFPIDLARTSKSSTTSTLINVLSFPSDDPVRRRFGWGSSDGHHASQLVSPRCQVADTVLTRAASCISRRYPIDWKVPNERHNDEGQQVAQTVRADARPRG